MTRVEQLAEILLKKPRLVARYAKIVKESARHRVMRTWISKGVEYRHLPNVARIQLVVDKIGECREVGFFKRVLDYELFQIVDDIAYIVIPFWYRRPVKDAVTWDRSGALIAVDLVDHTFKVPPPELLDLFYSDAFDAEGILDEETGIREFIARTIDERSAANE